MTVHCKCRYFMDPHIVFHLCLYFDIVHVCGLSSHVDSFSTIMDDDPWWVETRPRPLESFPRCGHGGQERCHFWPVNIDETMETYTERETRDDKRWQEMTRDDKRWQEKNNIKKDEAMEKCYDLPMELGVCPCSSHFWTLGPYSTRIVIRDGALSWVFGELPSGR